MDTLTGKQEEHEMETRIRIWGNYKLESRREYGSAARGNRGRYTGQKVHALIAEYIIGIVDESIEERPNTLGARFRRTGKPVLFSCYPVCGCTQGQNAGTPSPSLTEEHVTCTRCKG